MSDVRLAIVVVMIVVIAVVLDTTSIIITSAQRLEVTCKMFLSSP